MLELRNVSKRFSGIPAVDDVSFCARPGEVTGYLGANGSGKSTTMKMIIGLTRFNRAAAYGTPSLPGLSSNTQGGSRMRESRTYRLCAGGA
jgi:ABC-type multidrug transport system ATPase subunit